VPKRRHLLISRLKRPPPPTTESLKAEIDELRTYVQDQLAELGTDTETITDLTERVARLEEQRSHEDRC
jgi:iron uptake system EfeUOB component EfeO/EfeM